MTVVRSFESLLAEAQAHPVVGWDFSWLEGRLEEEALPWDYTNMVAELSRKSPDLLDLGTGGGEWLAALPHRPPRTAATEGWPPNQAVARERLQPLGVEVIAYEGPWDNVAQREQEPPLPFPDSCFHLVSDRHESFVARELARVLVPGGRFITQQVGGWEELTGLLGSPPVDPAGSRWRLDMAVSQLESAGLEILDAGEARPITNCRDVGALVWYLRAVPWAVPNFEVGRYEARLRELHHQSQNRVIKFGEERFWVLAARSEATDRNP